jgi:hypothetical protein
LQETMQPGFQCSWGEVNNIMSFFIAKCSVHMFCITGAGIKPTTSPARNGLLATGLPSDTNLEGLVFIFIAKTQ